MDPWWWRIVRAGGICVLLGYAVLSVMAIAESLASHPADGEEWQLGKPEYVAWTFAALAFPWFALMGLARRSWAWGFLQALSPPALSWYLYDLAAGVSDSLHHAEPVWIEWLELAFIYVAFVPWASWQGVGRMVGSPKPAPQS